MYRRIWMSPKSTLTSCMTLNHWPSLNLSLSIFKMKELNLRSLRSLPAPKELRLLGAPAHFHHSPPRRDDSCTERRPSYRSALESALRVCAAVTPRSSGRGPWWGSRVPAGARAPSGQPRCHSAWRWWTGPTAVWSTAADGAWPAGKSHPTGPAWPLAGPWWPEGPPPTSICPFPWLETPCTCSDSSTSLLCLS